MRAYKTELDLNNTQRTACARHAGAARYAYNWGLARKQEAHQTGERVSSTIDLHRELNVLKKTELSWMYEVSKCAPYPEPSEKPFVGVDLGINRMAQVSDGSYFENPRALKSALTRLKRLQRKVSRRKMGSANRQKAVCQLAKAHTRVANIRKNALHQATTILTRTRSAIVMEDLNVSGMLKNHHFAQAIADVGMYEFRRQLKYKGVWYGCKVLIADRFYPSTKRCSHCGQVKKEMSLAEREYRCECCRMVMDRDLNAVLNLEQLLKLPQVLREVMPVESM